MDLNSTINSTLHFFDCFEQAHFGMFASYIVTSVCFFLGTPAHSWLLCLFAHDGWKIKPTQVFLLNHTVLELMYCIHCALEILNLLIFRSDRIFRNVYIVFGIVWVGRPLMQTCICVEQYLAVIHPIIFLKYKDIQYRVVSAAVVWLVAAVCTVFWMFADTFPSLIFYIVIFTGVAVVSFCCVSVLRALKHPGPGDTQITTQRGRYVGNQQKRNAFKTILSALLIILFSHLPVASLAILVMTEIDGTLLNCDIIPFVSSLSFWGAVITPLLKIFKNYRLKRLNSQREIKEDS